MNLAFERDPQSNVLTRLVEAVASEDAVAAADALELLAYTQGHRSLPFEFMLVNASALRSGDYTEVGRRFIGADFIDYKARNRYLVVVGPYEQIRNGAASSRLSLVVGHMLSLEPLPPAFEDAVQDVFGPLQRAAAQVIPFSAVAMAGNAAHDDAAEAFIVPNWKFPQASLGPALNNMTAQRERFKSGYEAVARIFSPATASFLIEKTESDLIGTQVQHWEYLSHELGHATGVPLERKLQRELLSNPLYRGVEEWRSDGVYQYILKNALNWPGAASVIASNLTVRFGVDAHRSGGVQLDTDAYCAAIHLKYMLGSGLFRVDSHGSLELLKLSDEGLVEAMSFGAASAAALTRREAIAEHDQNIWGWYQEQSLSPADVFQFNKLIVEPCADIWGGGLK